MTHSNQSRQQNLELALRLFAPDIEHHWIAGVIFGEKEAMYSDIYATTWRELLNRGWLTDDPSVLAERRYRFTPYGWLNATKILGLHKKPEFVKDLGRLSKALKDCLDGRGEDAFTDADDISTRSGLEESFILNAIDCDFLGEFLNVRSAEWEHRGRLIRVPLDFGLRPV